MVPFCISNSFIHIVVLNMTRRAKYKRCKKANRQQKGGALPLIPLLAAIGPSIAKMVLPAIGGLAVWGISSAIAKRRRQHKSARR